MFILEQTIVLVVKRLKIGISKALRRLTHWKYVVTKIQNNHRFEEIQRCQNKKNVDVFCGAFFYVTI